MAHDTIQSPLILEIKGNSLDDGPGIRSVIFLKGARCRASGAIIRKARRLR